ncbi:uncharacterized protein UTRI_03503_B [Ustilago trichophora]|uniref:UBA domain-containing protein n=1 Tax=Ustilago trichophora TaxID=86804 RepID=A0A5C3E1Q6_9BASI|nr:uncharacterized protein UTRI_03503_B [Ustilago trichophora]
MSDRPALVQQVTAITGCNDLQAEVVLERCNWDMERAVNSYFDDPPPENPAPKSTTQNASTAVVPFQGGSDSQSGVSGWEVPNNPAYGPPPGNPPTSRHGWGQDNKDVIDLTDDADADDDLRRAMQASLQEHQSQQSYRPPAPSSTVGVSSTTATIRRNSTDHEDVNDQGPVTCQQIDDINFVEPLSRLPTQAEIRAIFDEDDEMPTMHKSSNRQHRSMATVYAIEARSPNRLKQYRRSSRWVVIHNRPGHMELAEAGGRDRLGEQEGTEEVTENDIGMSEDEQLRQALEASVQSHHDLLQSNGSGARTPALPQHLETDLESCRAPGAPVAMVAPFASLEVVAALLQALHAATPVRRAYLAARPVDQRGSDFANYWKGAPPTDSSDATAQPALEAHFELAQRIQTLFAFSQLSRRPLCVVKDVTSLTPSEVVARGADRSPPVKVASLYYEFLVESFTKHVAAVSDLILNNPTAEPVQTDALWMTDAIFLSSGAAALTSPASPRANGLQEPPQAHVTAPPKVEQQRSFIQLRHDSVHSDTYSCLRAALASDGEGALLTRTAHTISMGVDHALPTADGGPPPFTINERIHLDSLMWDRRQGVRLDAELRDLEMVRLDAMRQELEARKRKLVGDGGRPLKEVLSGAKRYFGEIASAGDGTDAIRSSSLAEATPQISKILEAVEADVVATDQLIAKIRAQIDTKRALVAERAKREASNPEWTQLAYDLVAVLCHEGGRCVSLVKQPDGTWWKVSGGRAVQVDREDVVMGRPQDPSLSVFWVVYARAEGEMSSMEETAAAEEQLIGEATKAAIADDNLTYESELLSLIRSDAATPSSTEEDVIVSMKQAGGDSDVAAGIEPDAGDITMTVPPSSEVLGSASGSPRTN